MNGFRQLRPSYSDDFRSVEWFGTPYAFTPMQAPCVEMLWAAWEHGAPELSQVTILDEIGSKSKRLRDLFKRSPAFNKMIVRGKTKGSYRLEEPPVIEACCQAGAESSASWVISPRSETALGNPIVQESVTAGLAVVQSPEQDFSCPRLAPDPFE
jgi:hypothetical protein